MTQNLWQTGEQQRTQDHARDVAQTITYIMATTMRLHQMKDSGFYAARMKEAKSTGYTAEGGAHAEQRASGCRCSGPWQQSRLWDINQARQCTRVLRAVGDHNGHQHKNRIGSSTATRFEVNFQSQLHRQPAANRSNGYSHRVRC
jgi:hypothetical protein